MIPSRTGSSASFWTSETGPHHPSQAIDLLLSHSPLTTSHLHLFSLSPPHPVFPSPTPSQSLLSSLTASAHLFTVHHPPLFSPSACAPLPVSALAPRHFSPTCSFRQPPPRQAGTNNITICSTHRRIASPHRQACLQLHVASAFDSLNSSEHY